MAEVSVGDYQVARNAVYDFYGVRRPTRELDGISQTPDLTEYEMDRGLSKGVKAMLEGLSPGYDPEGPLRPGSPGDKRSTAVAKTAPRPPITLP